MTTFHTLLQALTSVDALADFDRQAAIDAGLRPSQVRDLARVHETYFTPTRCRKQQRLALNAAREGGLSLDQLVYVEKQLARVDTELEQWRLRRELLAVRGNYDALKRRAKELLPPPEPTPPQPTVRFSASRLGMRTLVLVGPERDIADLEHYLRQGLNPDLPAGPQLLTRFVALIRGQLAAATGKPGEAIPPAVAPAAPRPVLAVPLDTHVAILGGHGDDTVLGLSDGTTITGADYLNLLAGNGGVAEAALFHPQEGPVNLYRNERLANKKQRDLMRLAYSSCLVPGCRHGSDNCESHHVEAWARGGETNIANLAPLCSYHNRVNDDDPRVARRGRISLIDGSATWISPRGYPAPNTRHRYGAMHTLFAA